MRKIDYTYSWIEKVIDTSLVDHVPSLVRLIDNFEKLYTYKFNGYYGKELVKDLADMLRDKVFEKFS